MTVETKAQAAPAPAQAAQPNAEAAVKTPAAASPAPAATPAAPSPETAADKVAAGMAQPEGDKTKAEPEKPAAAEAEVKYELSLAEDSLLDPEADIPAVVEFAKANKMAPEVAGKVLGLTESAVKSFHEAQKSSYAAAVENWKKELPGDPEIGGEKLPGALEDSKRLVEKFADKELKESFEKFGFLNNRFFIRFLARLGAQRRDDTIVTGKTAGGQEKTAVDIMFPMEELSQVEGK